MNYENNYFISGKFLDRTKVEHTEDWKKWCREIPELSFDRDWKVKIIPPFGGKIARFIVKYKKAAVSVYLDCFNAGGCEKEPYWEALDCCDPDSEPVRCKMNDVDKLKEIIGNVIIRSLKHHKTTKSLTK